MNKVKLEFEMVLTLHGGNRSIQKLRSFHHKSKKMFDIPGKNFLSGILKNDGEDSPLETQQEVGSATFAVEKSPVSKIPETAAETRSASPKERQPLSGEDHMHVYTTLYTFPSEMFLVISLFFMILV